MKLSYPKAFPKILLFACCALLVAFILARSEMSQKASSMDNAVAEAKDNLMKPLETPFPGQPAAPMSVLLDEALKLEQQGRPSEAVTAYEKLVEAQPDQVEGYLGLGALYFKLGLPKKAEELYLKAIQRGLEDGRIYFNLGYIEEVRADFPKALDYYLKAEEKLLKNGELFYNTGNVYAQMGNLDKALEYYTRSVSMNPDHMDAFVNMSVVSFRKGAYADADFFLNKAVLLGYQAPLEYIKALSEKLGNKPKNAPVAQMDRAQVS
jgi:tetratricopeptide (TPR) repeat protein